VEFELASVWWRDFVAEECSDGLNDSKFRFLVSLHVTPQAAHCLIMRVSRPFAVTVVVGSSYRSGEGGQRHSALRLFLHPQYNTNTLQNDVAVIRTASRIVFGDLVQPIPLSNEFADSGLEGTFTGWGFVSYGILPRRADLLQKMPYLIISNDQCIEMYKQTGHYWRVFDQKLCIISGFRQSVCGGDSGSPLVHNGGVIGVVSWRSMPCGDGMPDVFIRVSAVRDWILSVA
jgi:hypothetical protein